MRRLFHFFLTVSLLAGTRTFVHAQTAAYAEIVRIDAANFPQVSALEDVYDANGQFITGLEPPAILARLRTRPSPAGYSTVTT